MPNVRSRRAAYDAIIIGGGFYGASIALALKKAYRSVVILEKEAMLLSKASYINQATIHNGYHYPRSYLTALRSRTNFPVFAEDYPSAVFDNYERIYAVASKKTKVSAKQFAAFCNRLHLPISPASAEIKSIFDTSMVEDVSSVKEYAFNANSLRSILMERLLKAKVETILNAEVQRVNQENGELRVELANGEYLTAKAQVLCCVYGNTNALLTQSGLAPLPLKHEMTEVALIDVPPVLQKLGITVIDGPFFATMPFPATRFHSLTHVRYTPQKTYELVENERAAKPYSNFPFMIKDAVRYLPVLKDAKYQSSLFTVKTVLPQHERDDGRPILYRKNYGLKNFSVVLGGKIDNIYDIFAAMKL